MDDTNDIERARNRRVTELVTTIADALTSARELEDLVSIPEIMDAAMASLDRDTATRVIQFVVGGDGGIGGGAPLQKVVARLFREAPTLGPDQAPAVECHLMLRNSPAMLHGVLSVTPEGTLRLMTPTEMPDPHTGKPRTVLAEQFFDWDELVSIAMIREVTAAPSLIRSS